MSGSDPPNRRQSRARWGWFLLAAVAIGLVGVFLAATQSAEIVREGQLRPYTSSSLSEVRIFGIELVVDSEAKRGLDAVNGFLQAVVAGIALLGFLIVRARPVPPLAGFRNRRPTTMYAITAIGAGYLALDELLGIHETMGHNMTWLTNVPGIEHPDDLIFVLLALPVIAYVVFYRNVLLRTSRLSTWLFAAGFFCFAMTVVSDVTTFRLEEVLEVAASGFVLAGFATLTADVVRRSQSAAPPSVTAG